MDAPVYAHLRQVSAAYQASCVLTAAAELDLCTTVLQHNNAVTAPQLAAALAADLRGVSVVLDALAALGYLSKNGADQDAVYGVVAEFAPYLDSRTEASFIPMLRHMANAQRSWVELARAVRTGKPQPAGPSILGADVDRESFILGMNAIARGLARPTMEALRDAGVFAFAGNRPRLLDVGGASGTYTQAFLELAPGTTAVLFDRPAGVAAARERFRNSPLESRVTLVEGDFYRDALPSGCDLAWISAIIHQHGRRESRALYARVFDALAPGGRVAVRDFIMEPDRTAPAQGALFGVNMLVLTHSGMVYTFDEVCEDLEAAGFGNARLAVPAASMSAVVVAEKTGSSGPLQCVFWEPPLSIQPGLRPGKRTT